MRLHTELCGSEIDHHNPQQDITLSFSGVPYVHETSMDMSDTNELIVAEVPADEWLWRLNVTDNNVCTLQHARGADQRMDVLEQSGVARYAGDDEGELLIVVAMGGADMVGPGDSVAGEDQCLYRRLGHVS